jgi:hypothetical protein
MKRLTIILVILCAAAALAPAAQASSKQLLVMQDDALLYRNGPAVRDQTLDEFDALGTDVVKVQVYWREVAPGGRRKPKGFDGTDPAAYDWSLYDDLVKGIVARGMRPFLTLGNTAPDWAVGKVTRRKGIYRPSAKEFERFAEAAGTRYSGSYGGLPRVAIWSVWNEPNLFSWLAPQTSKGVPTSPSIYRGLYLAAHKGLSATGHARDTILLGELMPRAGIDIKRKVPPVDFLREMACLDRNYRPYTGNAAKARGCGKVGRIPTSGIAYHPYTLFRGGPNTPAQAGDAEISTLSRITKVADRIARKGRLPRRLPLWITEFGFQTNPPDRLQDRLQKVAGYMDKSEWITFRNRRVASYAQYTLRDEPLSASWQAGLRFHDGRVKKYVYDAFRHPVYVRALSASRVEIFGASRTAGAGATATIASRAGKKGGFEPLGSATLNAAGYFRKTFSVRSAANRTYRITIDGSSRDKSAAR